MVDGDILHAAIDAINAVFPGPWLVVSTPASAYYNVVTRDGLGVVVTRFEDKTAAEQLARRFNEALEVCIKLDEQN